VTQTLIQKRGYRLLIEGRGSKGGYRNVGTAQKEGRSHAREVTAQQIFIERETAATNSLHQHKPSAQQPQHRFFISREKTFITSHMDLSRQG
jgi:hypothetical protein